MLHWDQQSDLLHKPLVATGSTVPGAFKVAALGIVMTT